ncbi:MAG TPA: amino acid adenylation domain-containing protein, partial [Planctomycetota bacterium]|nr:amino acid adenylation domain-containing protein [Planctomycetota bacterium]
GLFVNSAVLRFRPDGDASFRALLQHVRAVATATFAHGDVPFERLVQHLAPERHLDRNPLFQVMFNYVDFATLDVRSGGVHWRYEEAPAGTLFDFTLYVRRRQHTIVLEAEFDRSLYEPATIEQRLAELQTLLQGAALAPETAVQRLPMLPPAELAALRAIERGPALPPGPGDAWSLVRERAGERASAVALGATDCSYRELVAAATRLGAALRASGVRPGDLVACHLPRGAWLAIAPLAIWHAGGVVLPLDPEVPVARRRTALEAARPRLVLVLRDGPRAPGADPVLAVDDGEGTRDPESACPLAADSAAYVLFTSGSTGEPKGVVIAHGALAAFLRAMRATLPLGPDDVLLAITSPSFDIAWLELLLPLCTGARLHIAGSELVRDGRALAAALAETRATFLQATPSTYRLLVESGFRGRTDLHLLCGGEALPDELAQSLRERCARLWNLYGPTETTIWSTVHEVGTGPVRIGRPLPGTTCHVLDEHGQRAPFGVPGELYIGGSGVALGYHGLREATAERFVTGPDGDRVCRTGDRVRWGQDRQLQFLGRGDDQIKLRGHRLELGAVEAWLAQHPAVVECAASTFATDAGPELAVHVVARDVGGETASTDGWQRVWQHTYTSGDAADPDFDTRGWLDSRTGEAIPAASMRRWRDGVAGRLAQLAPQRVLEVGCGTGLLVAALAGDCRQWLATDATAAAVDAVAGLAARRGLAHVTARQLAADALDELPAHAFDCVVLNSVVQYLPDLAYLLRVLDAARRRLAAGGTIWLGDVRLLPLHEAFVAWLELARAPDDLPRAEFAARCERRLLDEPELLLAPELFTGLVDRGVFADAWIALECNDDDTEMSRFRADVVLTVDTTFAPARALAEPLENARCAVPLHAFAARHDASLADVGALRGAAASASRCARGPRELGTAVAGDRLLHGLAAPLGARSPARRCDAPMPAAEALAHTANTPRHATDRSLLQRQLREHLAQHLPSALLPTRFEWLARLPRLPSGKLDRKSLRAPAPRPGAGAPPATDTERGLARLFTEVLGANDIGRDDDFFALGGHSLAAARLLARLRATFGVDLGLRQIFAGPTLRQLAAAIDAAAPAATPPLRQRVRAAVERPGATMERLWFLQRLTPGSRAYLMTGVVDAVGALDLPDLQRALDDVHARHEVLQLRLVERDGAASLVHDARPPQLARCADRTELERVLARIDGDGLEPLRVFCAPLDERTHRLAFVLHHAFADGWSIGVLQRDLAHAYAARRRGRAPDWSPLPLQYLDFVSWQDQLAADHERALAFWRNELADAPATIELPTARPRPSRLREPGARFAVSLPDRLVADCAHLAAELGATRFHVLLAAVQVWVARLAGQSEGVVGTTTANRDDPALEPLVGCFVRTLPLRARFGGEPSFAQAVVAARET